MLSVLSLNPASVGADTGPHVDVLFRFQAVGASGLGILQKKGRSCLYPRFRPWKDMV
jgi:hypothetical protein